MKYLAAYLLVLNGGNHHPNFKDIKHVLGSIGIEADEDHIHALLKDLEGKTIDELIAEGTVKLATGLPSGGSGAASGAAASGGAAAEEAEEEKEESEAEESDDDMGM